MIKHFCDVCGEQKRIAIRGEKVSKIETKYGLVVSTTLTINQSQEIEICEDCAARMYDKCEDYNICLNQLHEMHARYFDCKNELCENCGKYKDSHLGACDGCKWSD